MGQAYVLSNWIDYGMDIQASLDAARFFLYDGELSVEQGVPQATRDGLSQLGHKVSETDSPHGGGQAIYIDWENGVLQGGSDPRKDGHAAGF
jgi:gamma-glutamyltranspeptidase/glutathione hydrolase